MAGASRKTSPDAIDILMADHQKVQKMFRQFEKAHEDEDDEACRQIAEQVCAELRIHTTIEEEIFYPAAREALEEEDLIEEAEVEHASAKQLIEKLEALDPADPQFAATFTVLSEYIKHHVKEEHNEMFPKVKKARMDLAALGEEMADRKADLLAETGMPPDVENEETAAHAAPRARKPQRRGSAARH